MAVFRLRSDRSAVEVYPFSRSDGSFLVQPGETIEVAGDVTESAADHVVVGSGSDARIWPLSIWELEGSNNNAQEVTGQ